MQLKRQGKVLGRGATESVGKLENMFCPHQPYWGYIVRGEKPIRSYLLLKLQLPILPRVAYIHHYNVSVAQSVYYHIRKDCAGE